MSDTTLLKVVVQVALPDPNWVAVRDMNGVALNMDEWYNTFEVEAEVLTIHLRTGFMRVRFPWTVDGKTDIVSRDVPSAPFFERYKIEELTCRTL